MLKTYNAARVELHPKKGRRCPDVEKGCSGWAVRLDRGILRKLAEGKTPDAPKPSNEDNPSNVGWRDDRSVKQTGTLQKI